LFLWRLELVVHVVVLETMAFCNDDVEELRWRRCVSPLDMIAPKLGGAESSGNTVERPA
jgi:hypothetical protein